MAVTAGELKAYVDGNDDLDFKDETNQKVSVKSTGHEMPARLDLVKAYMEGKKYRKAREMYSHDYSVFEPWVVKHAKLDKFLHCRLTGATLPMDLEKVKTHMGAKRFKDLEQQAKEREEQKAARLEKKKAMWKLMEADEKAGKTKSKGAQDGKAGDGDGDGDGGKKRKKVAGGAPAKRGKKGAAEGSDEVAAGKGTKKKGPKRALMNMRKKQMGEAGADAGAQPKKKKKVLKKGVKKNGGKATAAA